MEALERFHQIAVFGLREPSRQHLVHRQSACMEDPLELLLVLALGVVAILRATTIPHLQLQVCLQVALQQLRDNQTFTEPLLHLLPSIQHPNLFPLQQLQRQLLATGTPRRPPKGTVIAV